MFVISVFSLVFLAPTRHGECMVVHVGGAGTKSSNTRSNKTRVLMRLRGECREEHRFIETCDDDADKKNN